MQMWCTLAKGVVTVAPGRSSTGSASRAAAMNVSFVVRIVTQRLRFQSDVALSFVPDAREPPNGCRPTTEPVGLSFT